MKSFILTICICFAILTPGFSQLVFNQSVIGSAGGTATAGGLSFTSEVGQLSVQTKTDGTIIFTEGFEQATLDICNGIDDDFDNLVDEDGTPVVNPITDITVCNNTLTSSITISGSIAGTVYNWTNNTPGIGLAASGSGNIPAFTAVNSGSTAIIATITVTPSFTMGMTTCTGAPVSFTITVNPTPNAVATPSSQTICSAQSITAIVLSGNVSGTVFNWTRNNTGTVTGIAGSGSGNITGSLTNTTNASVTVTFTITPTASGCSGSAITATVIVNPTPNAVATPSSQTICSAQSVTPIVLSGNVGSTVFNWTRNNAGTVTGIASSGSGNISGSLTNTTNAAVTVTFTITPTANGCPGTAITATVIVNPTPNVVALPSSQTICSGQAISSILLSGNVSGTLFNWTRDNTGQVTGIPASGSGNITGSLTNTTTAPLTVTFTITPVASGCSGTPVTATVLVNPTPDAFTMPLFQTICSGQAISTISSFGSVSNTTFNWTRNNTGSVTGIPASGSGDISGTLTNTTNSTVVVTFTITPVANGCNGFPSTVSVTVKPTPNAIATPSSQTICSGQPIANILLTGNVSGTTFNWTRDNTGIVTGIAGSGSGDIMGSLTNTSTAPVTVTFTITPTASSCIGIPVTATVTVNPTPDLFAMPLFQTICSGQAITPVSIFGNVANTTFNWTRDNTATVTGIPASGSGDISGSLTNTTNASVVVTFTVTPVANGCTGSPFTIPVTVRPTPNAVAAPSSQTVCSGVPIATIVFSGNVSGTVFSWSRDNNAAVTGISSNGTGDISGVLNNITLLPVTVTFSITPLINGCPGPSITATVMVNPAPAAIATPSSQTICSGQSITPIALTANIAGTTFSWTRNNTGTVTGIAASGSGNITGSLTNTTTVAVTVTFTITPTVNGCSGTPIMATVLVNPTPNAVATPSSQAMCSSQLITPIILSGSVTGTTYSWTRDNTGTVSGIAASGSGNISGTLINTTNAPVTVTFTIVPTANSCPGPSITATVVVNPIPNASATPSSQTICSGQSISAIVLAGNVSGTVFNWTRDNTMTVTGISASGSGNIAGVLSTTSTSPVTVNFIITPVANGCSGTPIMATVTVNPIPNVFAMPLFQTICSEQAITTISSIGDIANTVFNWTRNNTATVTGIPASGTGDINGILTNTTNASVVVTFTITPVANGCTGLPANVTVTVKPKPNAVATPSSQTICSGQAITQIVVTGNVSGTGFSWTRDNNISVTGIASSGSGDISGSLTNTTNSAVTVTFTIIPTANGCTGASITATVIVNPTPNAVATPPSQTVCSGVAITNIVLTGNVSGTVFNWTRTNTGTVTGIAASGSGNITGTLTNTTSAPVTVTFTITPVANGCTGTAVTATVLVNPTPNAVATPSSQTVCSGVAISNIVLTGNVSGTVFNWTRDNTATVTGIAGSGSGNISGTLTNTTNAPITVTFTITPAASSCGGAPVTATVLVNPTPQSFTVTGGGGYCISSDPGVPVGLSGSQLNVMYQLRLNSVNNGVPVAGTGLPISFGIKNGVGNYTVVATHTMGSCTANMTGSVNVFSYNCAVSITDPCSCKNNASTLINGQFNETVTVSAPSGQSWTVSANVGLYLTSSPAPPGLPVIIPNGFVLTETPQGGGLSNYTLMGVHVDALGYNITFTNGTTVLNIGNNCYYPNPQINGLNNAYCANDPAVTLNGTAQLGNGGGPATGSGSFTVNNIPSTQFNPATLGAGTHTVVFTFDAANGVPNAMHPGCIQSVSQSVTVNPTPTVVAHADITVTNCVNVPQITFTGNLPGTIFTWTRSPQAIGANLNGTQFVPTFNATNSGAVPLTATFIVSPSVTSNGITCTGISDTFTITVIDIVPPQFTFCPANITIECSDPVPSPATPVAIDACDVSVSISFVQTSTKTSNGTCSDNSYTITRTWVAADNFNNTSVCTQTITVRDITPPVITCPAGTTVSCFTAVPAPNIASVIATDNCSGVPVITFVSDVTVNQTCTNRYTLNRTYRATDVCGNSNTCVQVITVNDITPPVITCPAPVSVSCASQVPGVNIGSVIASDNCVEIPVITFVSDVTVNQTCTNRYTLNRTYRATDICGNSATCVQVITVNDIIAPTITCPANVTVSCASLVPAVNIASVVTSDNCGGGLPVVAFVSDVTVNQTCANRFTVNRTYRSTDVCGNSTTCVQTIVVNDIVVPSITCPANIQVSCSTLVPLPNIATVIASDNCGGGAVTVTFVSDAISNQVCPNSYTVTRTYRATDVCGNSATCTQTIIVDDQTVPVISGVPANLTLECDQPIPAIPVVTATDNCNGVPVINFTETNTQSPWLQLCEHYTYNIIRLWVATDACGNSSSRVQTIKVQDTKAPAMTMPPVDNLFANCDEGEAHGCPIPVDNCDATPSLLFEFHYEPYVGGCTNSYTVVRKWTAGDKCGNTTVAFQHVYVVDQEDPELTCPANIEKASDKPIEVSWTVPKAHDNCDGALLATQIAGPKNGSTFDPGTVTEISYATYDNCGNADTCTFTVMITKGIIIKPGAKISGALTNLKGDLMGEAEVTISGDVDQFQTSVAGKYEFTGIALGSTEEVSVVKTTNPLEGVNTLDLVNITNHILGKKPLGSPYKMLAADVNQSKSVSTADLVQIRKLILHITDNFESVDSWKFIPAGTTFATPANPWKNPIASTIKITDIQADQTADFSGIKMGDVTGDAVGNAGGKLEVKGSEVFTLKAENKEYRAGETVELNVTAKEAENMKGLQFTLDYDHNSLEYTGIRGGREDVSEDNFGLRYMEAGKITGSIELKSEKGGEELFTVTFKAKENGSLYKSIRLTSSLTPAEGYTKVEETTNLNLVFNNNGKEIAITTAQLYQNEPNPFENSTVIRFYVPESQEAALSIYTLDGKIVKEIREVYMKGEHEVRIGKEEFPASGIYYYQLKTNNFTDMKKMMYIK